MATSVFESLGQHKRRIARTVCAASLCAAMPLGHAASACSSATPVPVTQNWTPSNFTTGGAKITIWTGPVDYGHQLQISNGTGKSLWVALSADNAIMKISTKGNATIYATPSPNSDPESIGYNGKAMWFTEWATGCIGTINAAGLITEYATGLSQTMSTGMATGLSGYLWFVTDYNSIYRIGPKAALKHFPIPDPNTQPTAITLGPDGNMWFAEVAGENIGNISPGGTVKEYSVFNGGSGSFGIAAGADGRIWFADANDGTYGAIGAIATSGGSPTYYTSGLTGQPASIVMGPDGNLYFGEYDGKVGRITTAGVITEYPLLITEGSFPVISLAVGPDKNIWFANNAHAQIGVLRLPIK